MPPPPLDTKLEAKLKAAFYEFASFGTGGRQTEMEGKAFIKLARDCRLLGKAVTTTDIDLIFAKVKGKGARKITFDQFVLAVDAVATKKGCAYEELAAAIAAAAGPVDGGTKAEAVRLHDDKAAYTGVYAKGGPTNIDAGPSSLASLCDRTPADARGVKVAGPGGSRRGTELIGARRTTGEAARK